MRYIKEVTRYINEDLRLRYKRIVKVGIVTSIIMSVAMLLSIGKQESVFEYVGMFFISLTVVFFIIIVLTILDVLLTSLANVSDKWRWIIIVLLLMSGLMIGWISLNTMADQIADVFDYKIVIEDKQLFISFLAILVAASIPTFLTLYTLRKSKEENQEALRISIIPFLSVNLDEEIDNAFDNLLLEDHYSDFECYKKERTVFNITNNSVNVIRDYKVKGITYYYSVDEVKNIVKSDIKLNGHNNYSNGLSKGEKFQIIIDLPDFLDKSKPVVKKYVFKDNLKLVFEVTIEYTDLLYNKYYQTYEFARCFYADYNYNDTSYYALSDFTLIGQK